MPTTRIAALCGTCTHAHVGHHDPDSCDGCGVSFVRGAPAALLSIDVDGLDITPDVEFVGRWDSGRRRMIEAALREREPQREPLRLIQGGKCRA